MTTPKENSKKHLDYLDSLRGLAALYVVLNHSIQQYHWPAHSLLQTATFPFLYGHYAVDLFIILSGFCLILPVLKNDGYLRDGIGNFYKKRAKRILPPYYIALAFSLLLIYNLIGKKTNTHWDSSIPVTNWDIISHLLLIQDIYTETCGKINHAFWSISVEWRIYFLFPLLVICWRKWGALNTTILATILSLVVWYSLLSTNINLNPWGTNPQYLGLFTFGMLSAYVSDQIRKYNVSDVLDWKLLCILSVISIMLYALNYYLNLKGVIVNKNLAIIDVIVGIFISYFLALLSTGKLRIIHFMLSWKPLVFIGTFAYSIYLIHAHLIQLIWQYVLVPLRLSMGISMLLLTTVGTAIIVALSYIFYLFAEKPFINKQILEVSSIKQFE